MVKKMLSDQAYVCVYKRGQFFHFTLHIISSYRMLHVVPNFPCFLQKLPCFTAERWSRPLSSWGNLINMRLQPEMKLCVLDKAKWLANANNCSGLLRPELDLHSIEH